MAAFEWAYAGYVLLILIIIAAFVMAIIALAMPGVPSLNRIGSRPNCRGATSCDGGLTLEPADAEFGGLVTVDDQTFAGDKTFLGSVIGLGSGSFAGSLEFRSPVTAITGATTLTAAQSNSVFTVSKAAAYTITLPAVAAGIVYRFIGEAVIANAVVIAGAAGLMAGHWRQISGAATVTAASTSIAFTATSVLGDFIDVYSDGVNWFVFGSTGVAAGMAFA